MCSLINTRYIETQIHFYHLYTHEKKINQVFAEPSRAHNNRDAAATKRKSLRTNEHNYPPTPPPPPRGVPLPHALDYGTTSLVRVLRQTKQTQPLSTSEQTTPDLVAKPLHRHDRRAGAELLHDGEAWPPDAWKTALRGRSTHPGRRRSRRHSARRYHSKGRTATASEISPGRLDKCCCEDLDGTPPPSGQEGHWRRLRSGCGGLGRPPGEARRGGEFCCCSRRQRWPRPLVDHFNLLYTYFFGEGFNLEEEGRGGGGGEGGYSML